MHDLQYRVKFLNQVFSDWMDYDPHEGIEIADPPDDWALVQIRVKPQTDLKNISDAWNEVKKAWKEFS